MAMHKKIAPINSPAGDLKPLLEKLLESLTSTVNAGAGFIRLFTPHDQALRLISSVGLPADLLEIQSHMELSCETFSKVHVGHGIHSSDLRTCKSRAVCPYTECQMLSLITVPIENHNAANNPVGMLTLFFDEPQESFEHISKSVRVYAQMLGTIIEHNKSNRDARRVDLIAERQAIANEIHDSLAQTLVYTRMRASLLLESIRTGNELMAAKYAHDVDEALESSQKNVRELITDFRCAMDPSGLFHALQTLADQFRQRSAIVLEYLNRVANLELPLEYEIQVYHIVQEALANVANHSGATHARLSVEFSGNYYAFTIEDNGMGGCISPPNKGHYGMMIMHERAQRIGGEIKINSSQGLGTRVQLFFPEPGADWREVND